MKAIRIHALGGVGKLRYEDAPCPELISGDDVIVQLRAAAVNYSDTWIRAGLGRVPLSFPHILGSDGAGVVVKVGDQVNRVRLGDTVCVYPGSGCGECEFCDTDRDFMCVDWRLLGEREPGTYAEYVSVPAHNCFPIPCGLSFEEAAAIPVIYLTLWRMLVTNAQLKPGEHILIVGIGGGVTAAALQIAGHLGARMIVASIRQEDVARAKEMGAEHVIDSTGVDFAKEVRQITGKRGVDVVLDGAAGNGWVKSLAALAKGGRLVTCAGPPGAKVVTDVRRVFWNHLKIFGSTLGSRGDFRQLLKFINSAGIRPVIERLLPLWQAAEAQRSLTEEQPFGKIVLQIKD